MNTILRQLSELYLKMDNAYTVYAEAAGLSCDNCTENCCTSYFHHHTYIEWLYLWQGMRLLQSEKRLAMLRRAEIYVQTAEEELSHGHIPQLMCPVNESGRCVLYPYRLLICRLHGTRNSISLPDGSSKIFPGCFRFALLHPSLKDGQNQQDLTLTLDRTPFYQELAQLEIQVLKKAKRSVPKVRLTLGEMLVRGFPNNHFVMKSST